MSVPEQLLIQTYTPQPQTGVAEDYARKTQAQAEQRLLQNPILNPTPEPGAAPTPDEGPPEVPGRQARDESVFDEPSVAGTVIKTTIDQVHQGVVTLIDGLMKIPQGEPGKGAHQAMMQGFLPMLAAPITALFSAAGQTLERLSPETANAIFLEGPGAESFNRMASLKFNEPLTPQESVAFKQPITVRQALEILGPFVLPPSPKVVKGAKIAGREMGSALRSERGSVGVPPKPSGDTVRLYHGSPLSFEGFDKGRAKRTGLGERGFSFSENPDLASAYAETPGNLQGKGEPGPHVVFIDVPRSKLVDLDNPPPGTPTGGNPDAYFKSKGFAGVVNKATGEYIIYDPDAFKAQGQPKGGIPKPPEGAVNKINLGRIEGSEQLKDTMSDLNKFAGERLEKHRQRKGHDKQLAAAANLRWSIEQMLTHEPETILVDEPHAFRLRETARSAAEMYHDLGLKAEAGDVDALAKLVAIEPIAIKLSALDEGQGTNLARGLEMRKEMATGQLSARTSTQALLDMNAKMSEQVGDPLLRFRRYQMLRPDQARGFFTNLYHGLRFGRDALHKVWIQGLLSNPKTHMANLGGTALVIAGDIPETMVAGWVNEIFFRNPEGVQLSEAAIKISSLAEAQIDGFRLMAKAWQTGEEPFGPGPLTEHPRMAAETYGFAPDSHFGRFIDVTGATLESKVMPTRALISEDAYMKGVAYRLELNALAKREALAEGKEGRALSRRVAELERRPKQPMIEAAQDQATLLTLNKELGPAGRAFMAAANATPGGRVLFPFLRTPINSAKYVGQRFPVLAQLSYQNWSDMLSGSPALRDKAIARQVVGAGASTVIAYLTSGGIITGNGPVNKQLAALQRDPNTSTKPPKSFCPEWSDECYGIDRLDPVLGSFVLGVANYVELSSQIPDQDAYDEWAAYGETFITAGGQLFVNKANMQGLANFLDGLKDPDSYGGKLMRSYARTVVPAGVRELTRSLDDNTAREVRSIPDAINSGLPWAASGVSPHRNHITGERVNVPPGWGPGIFGNIVPISVTKKNRHPVFLEIQANKIVLPVFPEYVGGRKPQEGALTEAERPGGGVRLTREERQLGIDFQTQDTINGRTLFQALERLVASDRYQKGSTGPGGTRELYMKVEYSAYQQRAIAKLEDPKLGSPNLRRDIRQKQEQAINQTRPVTSPKSPQFIGNPEQAGKALEKLIPGLGR